MGLVGNDLLEAIARAEKECRSEDAKLLLELANYRSKDRYANGFFWCQIPEDLKRIEIDG